MEKGYLEMSLKRLLWITVCSFLMQKGWNGREEIRRKRERKYIIAIHIAVVREVLMKTLTVSSVGTFRKELILIRKGNLKSRK